MAKNFMFDANNSTLSVIEELVEGEVPNEGDALVCEPNSIENFGNTIESTARSPLSTSRDAKKGTVTSMSSAVELSQDLTISAYKVFMSGALSANWTGITNMKLFNRPITDVVEKDGKWQFAIVPPLLNLPKTVTLIAYDFLDERRNGVLEIEDISDGAIKILDAVNKGFGIEGLKSNLDPNGKIRIEWEDIVPLGISQYSDGYRLQLPNDVANTLEIGSSVLLDGFINEGLNKEYTLVDINTANNTVKLYPEPTASETSTEISIPGKTFDIYSGALTGDSAETVDVTISAAGSYNITIGSITSTVSGSQTIQIQANGTDIVNEAREFESAGASISGLSFTHERVEGQEQITTITLVGANLSATDVVITYQENETKKPIERKAYVSFEATNWVNINNSVTLIPTGVVLDNSLCYFKGYKNTNNNGIKYQIVKPDDGKQGYLYFISDTPMVEENIDFSQTNLPEIQYCGINMELTDSGTTNIDESGNLVVTGTMLEEILGMQLKGQAIWIGTQNPDESFDDPEANGLARINRVDDKKIYLDKRNLPTSDDGLPYVFTPDVLEKGVSKKIPLFFGEFLRTYEVGDDNYKRKSYTYELKTTNDDGQSFYEYSYGNLINTLTLGLPSQEKATLDIANISRKAMDATTTPMGWVKKEPEYNKVMSTPTDVLTCRVSKLDDSGLATLWVDATIEINNNVNQEFAIGMLEPASVAQGNFDITLSGSVFYQNPEVASAITNNCTVSADVFLTNEDGGIFIDIPTASMSDGSREFTNNEKIKQSLTVTAYKENEWGYSISTTLFPYLPLEKTDACK